MTVVYFRPLWDWLCRFPLLLAEAALILSLIWGFVGRDFGIPSLFWHEQPLLQFVAGVATALLIGKLCFVGFLLSAREDWLQDPPPLFSPWVRSCVKDWIPPWFRRLIDPVPASLWWYLGVTWPWLLLLIVWRALLPAGSDSELTRKIGHDVFTESFNAVPLLHRLPM